MQSMDNGVVSFHYLCRTFDQLLAATNNTDKPSILEHWLGYILKVADTVVEARE
jgi:hypothetical protein